MIIRLDIAPTPATVREYAQSAVGSMQDVYGIRMNFSVDSLAHVDRVLREWREGGAPIEAVTKSLYALGSYAGEVIRQRHGGRWVVPPVAQHGEVDSLFLFLKLADGREWRPIALAVQALTDEAQQTLEQSARLLLSARP